MFVMGVGAYAVFLQTSSQAEASNKRDMWLKMRHLSTVTINDLHHWYEKFPSLQEEVYIRCFDKRLVPSARSSCAGNEDCFSYGVMNREILQQINRCVSNQKQPKSERELSLKCYVQDEREESGLCVDQSQYVVFVNPTPSSQSSNSLSQQNVYIKVIAFNRATREVMLTHQNKIYKNTGY